MSRRRERRVGRGQPSRSRRPVVALAGFGVVVALAVGFVLLGGLGSGERSPVAVPQAEVARSKGSGGAPVIVEEWSDFG